MSYKDDIVYNEEHRIWSSKDSREYFAPDLSIGEIIFHEMRRHPTLIAQVSVTEKTVLTREELHLNSMRVASYMRSLNMVQSDIVGIIARNTTHISAVAYACFFNGIAFHSLHTAYEKATIEKLYNNTKPRLIFCDGEDYEKVKAATAMLNVKIITMRNHQNGSISIDDVLSTPVKADFEPVQLEQGNDQTLAILSSSGTTGTPKAVTISNSRLILSNSYNPTTADVQYTHSTLDWISGLITTVTSGVYSSNRVIADIPFDPALLLRIIEKYKVSWLVLASAQIAQINNCPEFENANLDSLRFFGYGGGRCSIEAQNHIRSRLQSDCLHFAYGFTELGSAATINCHFDEKPNSVGRAVNGCKLKIINEQGEALKPNELGEVCVYTGKHWSGYFGNPVESQNIRDSELWFHSGDLGYIDEDGFLYIEDRKKDMLKYQNIIYYPHEIEDVISQMPGVADVCVFGVWNAFSGDEAAAAVVKQLGSRIEVQDIVDYVKQHCEATYKHLHGGAIIVDELKSSSNGKTNRQVIKTYFLETLQNS